LTQAPELKRQKKAPLRWSRTNKTIILYTINKNYDKLYTEYCISAII
jgi:hypothetical protein